MRFLTIATLALQFASLASTLPVMKIPRFQRPGVDGVKYPDYDLDLDKALAEFEKKFPGLTKRDDDPEGVAKRDFAIEIAPKPEPSKPDYSFDNMPVFKRPNGVL
ncbi:hypothetical protein BDR26DRAFT_921210 [Obelidium mucronatum]|nr:hypothetical protein BDR26DRAFT_921210 [Obelidium mucronatum]